MERPMNPANWLLILMALAGSPWAPLQASSEALPTGRSRAASPPNLQQPGSNPKPSSQQPGSQDKPKAPPTLPMPFALAVPREDRPIRIDGSLIDWPPAQPLAMTDLRQLSGTAHGSWRGPQDLQAQGFLMWDADHFYVALVVRDDWHRPLEKVHRDDTEIPPADAVVVLCDPARDTRAVGADPGRQEDSAFWLAAVGEGRLIQWDRLRGQANFCDGARLAVVRDDDQGLTTYEAQIPWRAVMPGDPTVEVGTALDLQLTVEDFDEVTDTMPQSRLGWTFGVLPWLEPALRATVLLAGPDDGSRANIRPPVRRRFETAPLPPRQLFDDLAQALRNNPAVATGNPEILPKDLGGATRLKALQELDALAEGFPRVDYLGLQLRTHRRMDREVAGFIRHGLPYFWRRRLSEVAAALDGVPPEKGVDLHLLPMGGWVVHSKASTFAVDPSGVLVAQALDGRVDFVILTQPLSVYHRHDELFVRLLQSATGQRVYSHLPFHLPSIRPEQLTVVTLGEPIKDRGVELIPLGPSFDSPTQRPVGIGWSVRMPDGTRLLFAGPQLRPEQLPEVPADGLVLPLGHIAPLGLVQEAAARLTVIEGALLPSRRAGLGGRFPLDAVHEFQKAAQGFPTILPAPGERVRIQPR